MSKSSVAALQQTTMKFWRCICRFGVLAALIAGQTATTAANAQSSTEAAKPGFVTVAGSRFMLDGSEFRVAGVNNHYLTFGSDREVLAVLDDAVAMGANVVRTFLQPVIGPMARSRRSGISPARRKRAPA